MSKAQTATPLMEALRRKVNALQDDLQRLEDDNEALRERVEDLEHRSPTLEERNYDELDKGDKATILHGKLRETATATNGKASLDYKSVMALWDGRPSPGHAYDIMRVAGTMEKTDYGEGRDGSKRVTIDLT
jgi:TolA-binding protein